MFPNFKFVSVFSALTFCLEHSLMFKIVYIPFSFVSDICIHSRTHQLRIEQVSLELFLFLFLIINLVIISKSLFLNKYAGGF